MYFLIQSSITATLFVAAIVLFKVFRRRRSVVSLLQGPPSSSWLLGHEKALLDQDQVGDLEFPWFRQYGSTLRVKDCFGYDRLLIGDAKALQHTLHTSGYRYPKTKDMTHSIQQITGNGVLTVGAAAHQRQRKVLNPAFSASQLRTFSSLFQRLTDKSMDRLKEVIKERGEIVNVHLWLGRITLDVIGESAFGYNFGSINDESNDLAYQLNHLFSESISRPTRDVIFAALRRRLPVWFMKLIDVQGKDIARFIRFQNTAKAIGRDILKTQSQKSEESNIHFMNGKDILNILAKANTETDEKRRLDEDEVLSQIATMIIAGHETSASTLTWILYELSRHPEHQDQIRKEIRQVRARYEEKGQLTPQDYDGMPFMNAVIKEGLRLHPIATALPREAQQDDIIPLSEPIITKTGVKLTKIPVEKGQTVRLSIAYYNRNPAVWGADADEWNPDRFLENRVTGDSDKVPVGVYANVLTFSGGIHGCIGWRFAVMEMQTILTALMENFQVAYPDGVDIRRAVAVVITPIVRGKEVEGAQMPLYVRPL